MKKSYIIIAVIITLGCLSQVTHAFYRFDRTYDTALTPNREIGESVIITWTIVKDGTPTATDHIAAGAAPESDFISVMDERHNVPAADRTVDLTNRNWFQQMELGLSYISAKTRISFVYVDYDDGTKVVPSDVIVGEVGKRADLRVGGLNLNNSSFIPGGYSAIINGGGVSSVLMNSAYAAFSNPVAIRGVFMHEVGHSLGLAHSYVDLSVGKSMMGYNAQGPQFDEIYAFHQNYGDIYEGEANNDSFADSYNLGTIDADSSIDIGTDIQVGGAYQGMNSSENDIVSIDSDSDRDFYSFTIEQDLTVSINLDPRGPDSYGFAFSSPTSPQSTAEPIRNSDLSFRVFNSSNNRVALIDETLNGVGESVDLELSRGTYYIRVDGEGIDLSDSGEYFARTDVDSGTGRAQFYSLAVSTSPGETLAGPVNPVDPAGDFVHCAVERQVCILPGPAVIRYGANGQFFEQTFLGGNVNCTNGVFGDPIRGTRKSCEYRLIAGNLGIDGVSSALPLSANAVTVSDSTGLVVLPDVSDRVTLPASANTAPDSTSTTTNGTGNSVSGGGSINWLLTVFLLSVARARRTLRHTGE